MGHTLDGRLGFYSLTIIPDFTLDALYQFLFDSLLELQNLRMTVAELLFQLFQTLRFVRVRRKRILLACGAETNCRLSHLFVGPNAVSYSITIDIRLPFSPPSTAQE